MSDSWEDEPPDFSEDAEAHPGDAYDAPEPCFASMLEWFETWLRPMYRRATGGDRRDWCDEWWQHEEAVSRLDALWRAWEALRLDPGTGLSVWWRDHADHHMAALLDPDGPFKSCGDGHKDNAPPMLAHTPPPASLFADDTSVPLTAADPGPITVGPSVIDVAAARRPPAQLDRGRSM